MCQSGVKKLRDGELKEHAFKGQKGCNGYRVVFFFLICSSVAMEKAMAPHSSTLAWKIPRTEEPRRLQSMRSLRVGHD